MPISVIVEFIGKEKPIKYRVLTNQLNHKLEPLFFDSYKEEKIR